MTAYNRIGQGYTRSRRADPRIVDELARLLALPAGSAVADIGAGTGNYTRALAERGYSLVAVEPSSVMRAQATPHPQVTWRDGVAEHLPLADGAVSRVVSTLAIHHFTDLAQAFREMARVGGAGPMVLFTFDTAAVEASSPWMRDYWPSLYADARSAFPPLEQVALLAEEATGRTAEIIPFPIPPDMADLFLAAGWQRPELYLDAEVRAGISSFALGDPGAIGEGVKRLRADLETGVWEHRYGAVRQQQSFDAGYRFLRLLSQP